MDKKGFAGAIFIDLSKAFDCLNHELLIAKLSVYGISRPALKLIHSFLNERQQQVKVNGSLSTSKQTSLGVHQGSVLGPLLCNIYINGVFYLVKDTETQRLEQTQYSAALAVAGAWRGTNRQRLYEELGWESLYHRR